MANYATNIFYASTENQNDLNKIEAPSRWEYPEKEMDQLVASLEAKDKVYIKILTYEFENEYFSFRIGKSSVSCPLKPSDSAPLKHSTMPP